MWKKGAAAILCVIIAFISGCNPFGGPRLPVEQGVWIGVAAPVRVLDESHRIHNVVEVTLTEPAVGKPAVENDALLKRWNPTTDRPVRAFLVSRGGDVFEARNFQYLNQRVQVEGTLKAASNPAMPGSGRKVVRLDDAAVVGHKHGDELVYTDRTPHVLVVQSITPLSEPKPPPSPCYNRPHVEEKCSRDIRGDIRGNDDRLR